MEMANSASAFKYWHPLIYVSLGCGNQMQEAAEAVIKWRFANPETVVWPNQGDTQKVTTIREQG
jgi:hypothetical protein